MKTAVMGMQLYLNVGSAADCGEALAECDDVVNAGWGGSRSVQPVARQGAD